MRHIKLEAQKVFGGTHVVFRIIEQTHRGDDFTPDGKTFLCDGISLVSDAHPECAGPDVRWVHVRGSELEQDDNALVVLVTEFEKIASAVEAYNSAYPERHNTSETFFVG